MELDFQPRALFCIAGHALNTGDPDAALAAAWIATTSGGMFPVPIALGPHARSFPDAVVEQLPELYRWSRADPGLALDTDAPHELLNLLGDRKKALASLEGMAAVFERHLAKREKFEAGRLVRLRADGTEGVVLASLGDSETGYLLFLFDYQEPVTALFEDVDGLEASMPIDDDAFVECALESLVQQPAAGWLLRDLDLLARPGWAELQTLALAKFYRLLVSGRADWGDAKSVLRYLKQLIRTCDPTLRKQLNSLLPELVNPAKRKRAGLAQWDAAAMGRLEELIDDAWVRVDHSTASYQRWKSILEAEAAKSAEEQKRRTVREPKTRVLRANVTAHELLSLEWPLTQGASAYRRAVASALEWLGSRLGTELPTHWATGIHEIELGGVRLEVAAAQRLFAMRLEHPDAKEPARTWRLEGTVVGLEAGEGGMVGLRLSTQDRVKLPAPPRSVPGLLDAWRAEPGLCVSDQVPENRPIDTSLALFRLRDDIADPDRNYTIWVFPTGHANAMRRLPALAQKCALTSHMIADYNQGLHVLHEGSWHSYPPRQAVPVAYTLEAAARQVNALIAAASKAASNSPRFRDVLEFIREATAPAPLQPPSEKPLASDAPEQSPGPAQMPARSSAVTDLQRQLDNAIGEADAVRGELAEAQAEAKRLRAKLRALEAQIAGGRDRGAPETDGPPAHPSSLTEITEWAPTLAPRVMFAEKALRAASRIDHLDSALIYRAVQALHDHYWPMRWGDEEGAKERWEGFLQESRLRLTPIGAAPTNHRYADAYQALVDGKQVTVDLHIQGNSSRDVRRCVRIYFHADEERRIICVGALPSHLDSTLS